MSATSKTRILLETKTYLAISMLPINEHDCQLLMNGLGEHRSADEPFIIETSGLIASNLRLTIIDNWQLRKIPQTNYVLPD